MTGPCGRRRARCAHLLVSRVGRSSTPAIDRPVDRLHDTCSRFVPVDRPGRPAVQKFLLKMTYGRPGGRSEPMAICKWRAGRRADVQGWLNGSILNLFCFLWVPTAIFYFQVVKLTPNDLVSLMNVVYTLPINRGHGF